MPPVSDPFALFVYGTLRRGEENHGVLANARLIESRVALLGYEMLSLGAYPGIIARAGATATGELYEVPRDDLAALDELEDYPELYDRRWVELANGAHALTYVLQPAHANGRPVLASGDWVLERSGTG